MFALAVRDSFAAAHRLESYKGKCEALHGHNFTVEAIFEGEKLDGDGMLVDFAILKGYLREVLSELDHTYLNEIPFFRERASSSEYIALFIYQRITELGQEQNASLTEVRVWESANSYAAYRASP
ncbi:MAG: queuosine biosynthesis protein QueD [Deltaproteobacteria bacterium]|jgi:6-pyruvoyltetrahydropterin/6-carboxytetrahydropterin synthase|nr:queuosine biosynthesis protein QueD [Deltaproteobacteria bacterium]